MERWKVESIDFEPHAQKAMAAFLEKNPTYKKMVQDRINDLLNFPELVWYSVFIETEVTGDFYTKGQQIELAGKAYKVEKRIVVTHFSYHR